MHTSPCYLLSIVIVFALPTNDRITTRKFAATTISHIYSMSYSPLQCPPQRLWHTLCAIVPLSEIEIEAASRCFHYCYLPKGTQWLARGQICRQIAFIEKGLLRAWYMCQGKEITRTVDHEGEFCTAIASFVLQQPSEQAIEALVNTHLWCISYEDLNNLYKCFPKWQELGRKVFELLYINLEKRLITLLSTNARERYIQLLQNEPELIQQVPLKHIASILGVKPETLSRIRHQFGKEGEL